MSAWNRESGGSRAWRSQFYGWHGGFRQQGVVDSVAGIGPPCAARAQAVVSRGTGHMEGSRDASRSHRDTRGYRGGLHLHRSRTNGFIAPRRRGAYSFAIHVLCQRLLYQPRINFNAKRSTTSRFTVLEIARIRALKVGWRCSRPAARATEEWIADRYDCWRGISTQYSCSSDFENVHKESEHTTFRLRARELVGWHWHGRGRSVIFIA